MKPGRPIRLLSVLLLASVARTAFAACGATLDVGQSGQTYSTIQSAVNAVPASLSQNVCVIVHDSATYSEQVTVANIATNGFGLTIEGDPALAGSWPTVKPPLISTAGFFVQTASFTLQNFILSVSTPPPGPSYGVYDSSDSLTVNNVSAGFPESVYVAGGRFATISNSSLNGELAVISGSSTLITGNVLSRISISGSTNTTIQSNSAGNAGSQGVIDFTGSGSGVSITSNTLDGLVIIDTGSQSNLQFVNNTITVEMFSGLKVFSPALGASVNVTSNTFLYASAGNYGPADTMYGLYLQGVAGAMVQSNAFFLRGAIIWDMLGAGEFYMIYALDSSNLVVDHNRISDSMIVRDGALEAIRLSHTTGSRVSFNDVSAWMWPNAFQPVHRAFLIGLDNGSTGTQIQNNVLVSSFTVDGAGIFGSSATVSVSADSESGFQSDYNDFYSITGTPSGLWGAASYGFFSSWTANTGQDVHSISADPLWKSLAVGAEDFHPLSRQGRYNPGTGTFVTDAQTSPTIDAGDPAQSFSLEPSPNGGRVNQGSYGDTTQASESSPVTPGANLWVGPSSGYWQDASNWSLGTAPVATDTVTIDANATVLTYTTAPITFAVLTLGDAIGNFNPTLVLSTGTTTSAGVVNAYASTLTQAMAAQLSLSSATFHSGALINHLANSSSRQYVVDIVAANNFTMLSGSSITVDADGYTAGPGQGANNCGAIHGGAGSVFGTCVQGPSNDSLTNPTDLGSGWSLGFGPYANGGGAIILSAAALQFNGNTLSANGSATALEGGAGGTINLSATTLSGTATLSANGGGAGGIGMRGAGGGGRIAVSYSAGSVSGLTMTAYGGLAGNQGTGQGGAGTIFTANGSKTSLIVANGNLTTSGATPFSSSIVGAPTLSISTLAVTSAEPSFDGTLAVTASSVAFEAGPNTLIFSTLTVSGGLSVPAGSTLEATSTAPLTVAGSFTLQSGGQLATTASTISVRVGGAMTVASGANVVADGLGFSGGAAGLSGAGAGGGAGSGIAAGGGAGHGGVGGVGGVGTAAGSAYDSLSAPAVPGSGGGGGSGAAGGAGGGVIFFNVSGVLTDNGTISAGGLGGASGSYGGGGGSGGSIVISAGGLSGTGVIQANGGNGGAGTTLTGGGGAGGRISGAAGFTGTVSANGGTGYKSGQVGSSYNASFAAPGAGSPAFTNVGTSSVTANWTANGNPGGTYYLVQLSVASDFSSLVSASSTTAQSLAFANLASGTTYYAEVAALSGGLVASPFTSLGSTQTVKTSGETWIGPSVGYWQDAVNWNNGAAPAATDAVTIDRNVTVLTYATAPVSFATLTLGDAGGAFSPVLVLSTGTSSSSSVLVMYAATLTQGLTTPIALSSATLYSGALVDHSTNTSTLQSRVDLLVSNNFTMLAGSSITVDAEGYASGPGAASNNCGAIHGGAGSLELSCPQSPAYDSITNPTDLGSGAPVGGPTLGGGAIILTVGALQFNGNTLSANGTSNAVSGSAGGTINITAGSMSGNATLQAEGATGFRGAGGGGRIAVAVPGGNVAGLTMRAYGGVAGGQGTGQGGAGTIFIPNGGQSLLIVANGGGVASGATPISASVAGGATLSISTLSVSNAQPQSDATIAVTVSSVALASSPNALAVSTFSVSGDLILPSGTTLLQESTAAVVVLGNLTVQNGAEIGCTTSVISISVGGAMTVASGATVTADAVGFPGATSAGTAGSGPGAGAGSASAGGGGAGHGGTGGAGGGGAAGGAAYDSLSAPILLGSGGGGGNGTLGGAGGGAIMLSAGGGLTVNGTITANGAIGSNGGADGGGGGSGGSVYLSAGTLAGSGQILANGANGGVGTSNGGGGGAGGRIAVPAIGSFTGSFGVSGGSPGIAGASGSVGTLSIGGVVIAAPTAGAFNVAFTSVAANWGANGDPAGTVYIAQISTDGFATINASSATQATSSTFTALSVNTTYYFRVNADGGSFTSLGSTVTLAAAPTSLSFSQISISSVALQWSANGNPAGTSYVVDYWLGGGSTSAITVAATTAAVTGLTQSTSYFFTVQALNHVGALTPSGVVLSTDVVPVPPGASSPPSVWTTSAAVNWTSNGNVAGTVYTAQISTNAFVTINAASATLNTSATFQGLAVDTTYYFRAQAGASAFVSLGSSVTAAAAPTSVAVSQVGSSSITVQWSGNGNPAAASYRLSYWTAGGSTSTVVVAASSASASGLSASTTYFLTVDALSFAGAVTRSGVTLSTTTSASPSVSASVSPSGGSVVLNTPFGPVTLQVPAGAVSQSVTITLSVPASFASGGSGAVALTGTGVGLDIETNPSIEPLTNTSLTLSYQGLNVAGLDPSKFIIARYDSTEDVWVPLVSSVDTTNRTVTAVTSHWSLFQIMQANPSSSVSTAKAFPNPWRVSQGPASMTFVQLPASARVRIYTLTGLIVKDLTTDASGMVSWDGTNEAGRPVASGFYFAFAQGAGQKTTIKLAIQR